MKEVYLNRDSRILLKSPTKKIYLVNPNQILVQDTSIWSRLICTLGKCEFESWLADEVTNAAKNAIMKNEDVIDMSYLSGAVLQTSDSERKTWKTVMSPENFTCKLKELPIFQQLIESEQELIIKFVPAA